MKKATSIGGIFFKSKDPKAIHAWYRDHLGLNTTDFGAVFEWKQADEPEKKGFTVWSAFKADTTYFDPSEKDFMINLRVEDLPALLAELKEQGVEPVNGVQEYEYGKFAHIMDPDGNKLELWQPNDTEFEKMGGTTTK